MLFQEIIALGTPTFWTLAKILVFFTLENGMVQTHLKKQKKHADRPAEPHSKRHVLFLLDGLD